ncbi:MAG: transglutaminase family protein [Burkholderiaceae bacterium]|nr:transglutaminase family protein [Burkholderiaceae bacterium]
MSTPDDFETAVRRHDARVAALGLTIWVGSEPTFTDRLAQTPEWLSSALGGDKELRAQALLGGLSRRFPGGLVLRSVGRQYPGEAQPRWNLGLYRRRDGVPLWQGPPDPILAVPTQEARPGLEPWAAALSAAFQARGFGAAPVGAPDPFERRLLMRAEVAAGADAVVANPGDPRLARPSVHAQPIPASGLRDELAEAGAYLFVLRIDELDGRPTARIELPRFTAVPLFLDVLQCLEQSSLACRLPVLIVAGYPPPADATVELGTVTPDPAVVEINTAPSADAASFLWRSREIYAAAADQGLAPYRLYFNGTVADSGGGGQITLGGASPRDSPFLQQPRLLPRLVRFLNRHPALSYLFCHDFVGSSGQSVRADERGSDAFDELALALALLERQEPLTAETLWHGLAPFLCDAAGNSHRAEVNIEKLWNPFLAGRGQLGLVEFRALRMQHTPERATALACLLRSVAAMLAGADDGLPLVDWGRELHQRFALPFYLEQDLRAVLASLAAAGLALDEAIESVLWRGAFRRLGQVQLPGCSLELRRALEFWPLLGDAASPEQGGGSRLIDASTARVELRLRPVPDGASAGEWQVFASGVALPMRHERDAQGEVQVFGLRYRSFVPRWGLHPTLGAQAPVRVLLRHPGQADDHRVTLHEWRPDGQAYPGLPEDLDEARQRRADRITLQAVPRDPALGGEPAPLRGLDAYGLDLRCL